MVRQAIVPAIARLLAGGLVAGCWLATVGCAVSMHDRTAMVGMPALTYVRQEIEPSPASSDRDPTSMRSESAPSRPIDVEYGHRRPVIDGIGTVLGFPRKLLLWDRRADNHRVSDETVGDVAAYLDQRDLTDVKVRVNQYAPMDEWRRLVANKQIAPGWRYTLGVLKHVEYTLLPGRIWGGDQYNPYTNSLSLYSDVSPLGIVEAAYATDIRQRAYPGVYAASQELPIVALWHESLATNEALNFVTERSSREDQEAARRLLYARYGMEVGGELGSVGPTSGLSIGGLTEVIGAAGGHAVAGVENVFQARRQLGAPAE